MNPVAIIPSIAVLRGRCVLTTPGDETVDAYDDDPVELAAEFAATGAKHLHVVDLDSVRGSGDSCKVIKEIRKRADLKVLVAGEVRTEKAAAAYTRAGAHGVVIGSAAARDPDLLRRCAQMHPGQIVATVDVREKPVEIARWSGTEPVMIGDLLGRWAELPLGGVILSCVDREGAGSGPDLESLAMVRRMTAHFLHYSGGVATREDISRLSAAGAQAIIVGRALHEGKLTLGQAFAR
ncbi:MAG: HisA/HisF-related TIM barrel protein [Candidatus Dormibacterales bacterium]